MVPRPLTSFQDYALALAANFTGGAGREIQAIAVSARLHHQTAFVSGVKERFVKIVGHDALFDHGYPHLILTRPGRQIPAFSAGNGAGIG